ncbi:MAG: hypothetical protein ACYTG3_00085 [Planctomycetota bacterium]
MRYAVDAVEGMDARSLRRFRLGFLLIAYVLFALRGARDATLPEPCLSDLAMAFLAAIAVTKACVMDSRLVGKPLPRAARWVMFFTWPLAVPVYLVWSRGWVGLAWIAAHLVAATVVVQAAKAVALVVVR